MRLSRPGMSTTWRHCSYSVECHCGSTCSTAGSEWHEWHFIYILYRYQTAARLSMRVNISAGGHGGGDHTYDPPVCRAGRAAHYCSHVLFTDNKTSTLRSCMNLWCHQLRRACSGINHWNTLQFHGQLIVCHSEHLAQVFVVLAPRHSVHSIISSLIPTALLQYCSAQSDAHASVHINS